MEHAGKLSLGASNMLAKKAINLIDRYQALASSEYTDSALHEQLISGLEFVQLDEEFLNSLEFD